MTKSTKPTTPGGGIQYLMARSRSPMERPNPSQYRLAATSNPEDDKVDSVGQSVAGVGNRVGIEPGNRVTEEHLVRILGMVEDPSPESSSAVPARAEGPLAECASAPHRHRDGRSGANEGDGEVLRIKSEERAVEAKIAHAVAGFDLTFSAPKSVSAP